MIHTFRLAARMTARDARAGELRLLLVALAVNLALVWFLFRVHARPWLGGPGPLLVDERGRRTHGGCPPRR